MRKARLFTAISAALVITTAQATGGNVRSAADQAQDKLAAADCSINWVSETGRIYCFGNEDLKESFVKDVTADLSKPQILWNSDERWHP